MSDVVLHCVCVARHACVCVCVSVSVCVLKAKPRIIRASISEMPYTPVHQYGRHTTTFRADENRLILSYS